MERNEELHAVQRLRGNVLQAVVVQDHVLDSRLDLLEGLASDFADLSMYFHFLFAIKSYYLIASEVDLDQTGHIHEGDIRQVPDLVTAQVDDVQRAQSFHCLGGDFRQVVGSNRELLQNPFQAAECVRVDLVDAVVVENKLLDAQVLECAWTDLNNRVRECACV